jgi:hypothetical protein
MAPAGEAPAAIVISVPAATTAAAGHSRGRLLPRGRSIAERKVSGVIVAFHHGDHALVTFSRTHEYVPWPAAGLSPEVKIL